MRRFLKKAFIFGGLQILILAFICTFNVPHESSYMYGYEIKKKLLKEVGGKRIILVGCSSLAFGLNSEIIKEATSFNPINMGLHAGLGRKLTLNDTIIEALKPNDLVVLCLEYDLYGRSPAGEALWQLLRIDSSTVFDLSLSDVIDLSESGFSYVGGQLRNAIKNLVRGRRSQPVNLIYTTDGLNEYGDLVSHWKLGHQNGPRAIKPLMLEGAYFRDAFNDVSGFVHASRTKGARVVFSFPPIREDQYLKNKRSINALTQLVVDTLQLEIIASAEAMAFPEECFFDTAYHLNYDGVERRSKILSDALAIFLDRQGAGGE